jgi:hypothetical protein
MTNLTQDTKDLIFLMISYPLVTAKTPPTTAQIRTKKWRIDGGVSLTVITIGDISYKKSTAGT